MKLITITGLAYGFPMGIHTWSSNLDKWCPRLRCSVCVALRGGEGEGGRREGGRDALGLRDDFTLICAPETSYCIGAEFAYRGCQDKIIEIESKYPMCVCVFCN